MGHPCKFKRVSRLGSVTARHSSSGRQPNFAALNRGRHLYSAERPSRWALTHILHPCQSERADLSGRKKLLLDTEWFWRVYCGDRTYAEAEKTRRASDVRWNHRCVLRRRRVADCVATTSISSRDSQVNSVDDVVRHEAWLAHSHEIDDIIVCEDRRTANNDRLVSLFIIT